MPIPAGPDLDPSELPPELSAVVGDKRRPELTVTDEDGNAGDGTTVATLTVTAPGGTPTAVPVTNLDGGTNWVATQPYTFTGAAGRWIERWDVTGRGADLLYTVVLVHPAPTAGGQTWIPTREQVAAIIPRRTHVGSTTGWGTTQETFSDVTTPTARTVDVLISQAARWVEALTGPIIQASIEQSATDAAAMYTAALILLQWPDGDGDRDIAKTLLAQAIDMRKLVAAANVADTGTDPVAPVAVMPVWSFPPATEIPL